MPTPKGLELPEDLKSPAVLPSTIKLTKKPFVKAAVGRVTDILVRELPEKPPRTEVCIAGSSGGAYTNADGKVSSTIPFDVRAGDLQILPGDVAAPCRFVDRGGGWQPTSLLSEHGKALWTFRGLGGVDDMVAGHVTRDKRLDFVVGMNGGGGVILLDDQGKERWTMPGANIWHVEILDATEPGGPAIIHSDASGKFTFRDGDGKDIKTLRPPGYASSFSLCRWPREAKGSSAVVLDEGQLWLVDLNGKKHKKLKAPRCQRLGGPRAISVRLDPKKPPFLAVTASYQNWSRCILALYDDAGTLVYEEILASAGGGMAVLPGADGKENLLVGGEDGVWRYSL